MIGKVLPLVQTSCWVMFWKSNKQLTQTIVLTTSGIWKWWELMTPMILCWRVQKSIELDRKHYSVKLLLKYDQMILPYNLYLQKSDLYSLYYQLWKTPQWLKEYNNAMKIRIVSDKSFIRQGQPSLNECLEAALYLPPRPSMLFVYS